MIQSKVALSLLCSLLLVVTILLSVSSIPVQADDEDVLLEDPSFFIQERDLPYFSLSRHGSDLVDINDFLTGVIENFREDMISGIPDLKVPVLDPFQPPKPIKLNVEDKSASVKGNFTDIRIEGLSQFVLEHLNANLHNLSLNFRLRIPRIYASGEYVLDGKIIKIVPIRGNGSFWVESKNLSLEAKASMSTTDDGHLQLSNDFDVHIDFDQVQMDFENLLGGGRWTEVLKEILNSMSKDLFVKFLPLLKKELNSALLKVINKQLTKIPITAITPAGSADEYVDQILANVRTFIQDQNYDPMELPDYNKNFSKKVIFIDVQGDAKMYDGWLHGISSIHRTDECKLESNRTTIAVSAHLGLKNLKLSYKGHAKFMNLGPSIECGGRVSEVSFFFSIEQSNKRGAKPRLKDLQIVEMSTIWIELSGLGPLTWIMQYLLTGISKLVEDFIVEKVTSFLRDYLEAEFQKVSFPVF